MLNRIILLCVLGGCTGLTQTQVKNITRDATAYSLCLELCIHRADSQEEFDECANLCDKQYGVDHGPLTREVARTVSGN